MIEPVAFTAAALWALGFLFLSRFPRCPAGTGEGASDVSVIIPARNEEPNLPRLLASLAAQDERPREVIVVDDHSEDGTARVACAAGVSVMASADLPPGWLGKPWACAQGAAAAGGKLLLFLDADTVLEPGGLGRIIAAYRERSGIVSVWPFHRMERPYEWLSAFFLVIVMAAMRAFTPLGRRLSPLGAFGPCILCSREDYLAAGGHHAVSSSVLDDVDLGRAFRQAGKEVHCLTGRGAISFRMYPHGISTLVAGFTKNMASGAFATSVPLLLAILGWIGGASLVTFEAVRALAGHEGAAAWLALDALYILQTAWWLTRLGTYPLWVPVLFQVPLAFFGVVSLGSFYRTAVLKKVTWKGRTITVAARPAGGNPAEDALSCRIAVPQRKHHG